MKASRILLSLAAIIALGVAVVQPVSVAAFDGAGVQGYASETKLDNGTIVQLADSQKNIIKPAIQSEMQNMFGVTVDRNLLPVTLTSGVKNETFVAVSGTYNVLVSTQGGPLAAGDYITLSSLNGIAMKAGTAEVTVFGRTNAPFDGEHLKVGEAVLRDSDGVATQRVAIGMVPVTIDIKSNPNHLSTDVNIPDMLRRVGQAIAEKEVSPLRIYLSLGIAIISVAAAIVIIYAGVRHGVVSIGRNPMSKQSIFRALIETILTSLLILIIGLFAVYLLLRL